MKQSRAFFHTFRLQAPRRLWLPLLLLGLFSLFVYSYNLFEHHHPVNAKGTTAATNTGAAPFVMIDPGHGGYDPGVKMDNLTEANLTLSIAKQLQQELQKRGIQSALTRESDIDYSEKGMRGKTAKRADLGKRIELAKEKNATIFISLHANKSAVATRGGAEVFYNESTPGAKQLAETVQTALHGLPKMSKRDAKSADYYLLRNQSIPALIIECGYLNIAAEKARLIDPSYQQKLAATIAQAVDTYIKSGNGSGSTQ